MLTINWQHRVGTNLQSIKTAVSGTYIKAKCNTVKYARIRIYLAKATHTHKYQNLIYKSYFNIYIYIHTHTHTHTYDLEGKDNL